MHRNVSRSSFSSRSTTGRVVSHFLSGTQTRRIGPLVHQYPEPRIEMHPRLAEKLGIGDGEWATAETRRGAITLRAMVVTTIRPDTIFIPYHWPGEKSANRLTVAAQDPISKIPQYKVCGCRVRKAGGAPAYAATLEALYRRIGFGLVEDRRRLEQIYAERTGQSVDTIAKDCDRNKWLDEEEMLEYGLIDKVLTRMPDQTQA